MRLNSSVIYPNHFELSLDRLIDFMLGIMLWHLDF